MKFMINLGNVDVTTNDGTVAKLSDCSISYEIEASETKDALELVPKVIPAVKDLAKLVSEHNAHEAEIRREFEAAESTKKLQYDAAQREADRQASEYKRKLEVQNEKLREENAKLKSENQTLKKMDSKVRTNNDYSDS